MTSRDKAIERLAILIARSDRTSLDLAKPVPVTDGERKDARWLLDELGLVVIDPVLASEIRAAAAASPSTSGGRIGRAEVKAHVAIKLFAAVLEQLDPAPAKK